MRLVHSGIRGNAAPPCSANSLFGKTPNSGGRRPVHGAATPPSAKAFARQSAKAAACGAPLWLMAPSITDRNQTRHGLPSPAVRGGPARFARRCTKVWKLRVNLGRRWDPRIAAHVREEATFRLYPSRRDHGRVFDSAGSATSDRTDRQVGVQSSVSGPRAGQRDWAGRLGLGSTACAVAPSARRETSESSASAKSNAEE